MIDTMLTALVNEVGLKKTLAKMQGTPIGEKPVLASRARRLGGVICFALLAGASWAGGDGKHLGVATCASSVCHGRVEPAQNSYAALNEYRIWAKRDAHSRAYHVLENEQSRSIAARMGLEDATTAPECLACHADNVSPARRGERFQLSDGIGCETCHGGAEHWIDSHYGANASHDANLKAGMQPTESPAFQARLCQSCHLGDTDRLATHEMMAAGHPRLRFELDTWLALMPPHHVVDEDYRRRKGSIDSSERWQAGQLHASRGYVELLDKHLRKDVLIPEPAILDCHACHRPIETATPADPVLPPGAMRLNDSALQMLIAIAGVRDESLGRDTERAVRAMRAATPHGIDSVRSRLEGVQGVIDRVAGDVGERPLSDTERERLRASLLRRAAHGDFRDYSDAEQLFLALQALTVGSGEQNRYDEFFAILDNERDFDARRFARAARKLLDDVDSE